MFIKRFACCCEATPLGCFAWRCVLLHAKQPKGVASQQQGRIARRRFLLRNSIKGKVCFKVGKIFIFNFFYTSKQVMRQHKKVYNCFLRCISKSFITTYLKSFALITSLKTGSSLQQLLSFSSLESDWSIIASTKHHSQSSTNTIKLPSSFAK